MMINEIRRCLHGRGMKLVVILSLCLALGQFYVQSRMVRLHDKEMKTAVQEDGSYMAGVYPMTLYEAFIGGENYTFFNQLYYYILPLLAVLPFGVTFFTDESSGYLKYIYSRVKKLHYLAAKYAVTFVSGAIAAGMAYIMSFAANALIVPVVYLPNQMAYQSGIIDAMPLSEIWYTKPWVYTLIYWLITMLFGGILATVALCVSFIAKNMLLVLFSPFLLYVALDYAAMEFDLGRYSIYRFINPKMDIVKLEITMPEIFACAALLMICTLVIFLGAGYKRERIL